MRKKTIMMVVIVVLMVALFATAAYAAPALIEGTPARDILRESNRNDIMYGYGGNDTLRAFGFVGEMDVLYGGDQNDYLNTADEDNRDTNFGGRGYDVCVGDSGDSFAPGCNEVEIVEE